MRTVYRYTIQIGPRQPLFLPEGAEIVHVTMGRHDVLDCVEVWVLQDMANKQEERTFMIHGTGHDVEDNETYIGTGVSQSLSLVWHLFEVVDR